MNAARMQPRLEVVLEARTKLAEGPLWSSALQQLYWVEIIDGEVHRFDPASGSDRSVKLPGMLGAVAERASGSLAVAWAEGFAALDFDSGAIDAWCDPEAHLDGTRFNDGKCDASGRFWAGTCSTGSGFSPVGALYLLDGATDRGRVATKLLDGVSCSNGLCWSDDQRTLYYIDTALPRISAFACDPHAAWLGERRVVVEVDDKEHGWLDGMCIDAEGMLWTAHWGGGRVNRWDPRSGRLLETVTLPVANVTSCAFGGAKLDELYITTAKLGLSEAQAREQPLAGCLFRYRPGTVGLASTPFSG